MSVFLRRLITGDDLRRAPVITGDVPPVYVRAIATFAGLAGTSLSVRDIIRGLDLALGTENVVKLLAGNTPTVLMTSGPVLEVHLRSFIPNKDLQTNLVTNIVKECAHVAGIPNNAQQRLDYARLTLNTYQFDAAFNQHVLNVLADNDAVLRPWVLMNLYPGA
jgi:hypothetical protein